MPTMKEKQKNIINGTGKIEVVCMKNSRLVGEIDNIKSWST